MKKAYRQIHTFAAIGLTAAFVLTTCTACSKENKTVPTMATVSSLSSDIWVSSLADSMASSAVSSTASSSTASSTVSKASSSGSSTASKSTGSPTTKPTGGSTVKPSGGSTTKPSGGGSTGGSTTKQSVGGSTAGGGTTTTTQQQAPAGISTVGYASTYGCQNQDQYNYVRSHAAAMNYSQDTFQQNKEFWNYSVAYSDALNDAISLIGCIPRTSGQSDNAYDVFVSHNGKCDGVARAEMAVLQTHGYNAKVAYGKNSGGAGHAWITFACGGTWYSVGGGLYAGYTPAGYSLSYTSYQ